METTYILHTPDTILGITTKSKDYFIKVIKSAKNYGLRLKPTPIEKSVWGELVYNFDESDNEYISGYQVHIVLWSE